MGLRKVIRCLLDDTVHDKLHIVSTAIYTLTMLGRDRLAASELISKNIKILGSYHEGGLTTGISFA
jgi:hypothetical protein